MIPARSEDEIYNFYTAWSRAVFGFCRLLCGDDQKAEGVAQKAFHEYLRRGLGTDPDRTPALLFTYALEAARETCPASGLTLATTSQLREAVLFLPIEERAVFVLRDVMDLDEAIVGKIIDIPIQEVGKRRIRSLLRLRQVMSEEFFQEQGMITRKWLRKWFGLLLPLFFSIGLFAQEPQKMPTIPTKLDLDVATELLMTNNPTILRERQNIALARADVTTARILPNPDFEVNSESYPLFEPRPGPFLNNQELVVRAGQTIETAGKRGKRTKVAQQDVEVTESALQDTIRQLKLELRDRYCAVVLAKAQRELAQQILSQFDEIIRLNEVRFRQGEVSGLELARVQTERLRFFNDSVAAELQLKNAKASLLELLGVSNMATEFDVMEKLEFKPLQAQLETLGEEAVRARPDLLAERQRVERDRRQLTLAKAQAIPNITPFFGYKRDFGANTMTFGVSIPLPLFNRNQGGIARAGVQVTQQQYELERTELSVRRDVQQVYQTVVAQERRVRALESTYLASAQKARDIAQASYRLGALDLVAFLDAERAYRETLREYYQALFDHQVAVFQLSAAVGKEL